VVMAKDKPTASWHPRQRALQNGIIARIRDQPYRG